MKNTMEHPTIRRVQEGKAIGLKAATRLDAAWLRQLALDLGADDVGFVELDRAALAADREDILTAFPQARSLVGLVCRRNREPIRTPARSVANLEFHHTDHRINEIYGTLRVQSGHIDQADLRVTADSRTWLRFLAKEADIVWAMLRRKIPVKGPMRLMPAFGRCFPS